MTQEEKDSWHDSEAAEGILEGYKSDVRDVLGFTGYSHLVVHLAVMDGIAYGRKTPDREILIRFVKHAAYYTQSLTTPEAIVDQFLQSESEGEK